MRPIAVLLDDGNYLSSETPAQRAKSRTHETLWQAIQRAALWHPQVNDDEMPSATEEQARVHAVQTGCHLTLHAVHQASRHTRRSKMRQHGLPRRADEQTG